LITLETNSVILRTATRATGAWFPCDRHHTRHFDTASLVSCPASVTNEEGVASALQMRAEETLRFVEIARRGLQGRRSKAPLRCPSPRSAAPSSLALPARPCSALDARRRLGRRHETLLARVWKSAVGHLDTWGRQLKIQRFPPLSEAADTAPRSGRVTASKTPPGAVDSHRRVGTRNREASVQRRTSVRPDRLGQMLTRVERRLQNSPMRAK
jgi:hypothetical protein